MKQYVSFALFVLVISSVKATDFLQDAYIFLPLIKSREPPPQCSINELYKTCTGMCSDCEQRGRCPLTTCQNGCDCAPRFYRVTPDGPCEPVANCPKPECGENEVFRECGPICERCTSVRCKAISCDHKCYCNEGYLRNENGECIPAEECPKREHCFRHEEWAESGLEDESCPMGQNKTATDKIQNVTQCYCVDGYKRDLFGHCVEEKRCSSVHCFGLYVYHECIPKCNTTCRSYGDPNCTEDDNCFSGCFCPQGFVMNDLGSCIPQENCSLDISQVKVMIPSEEDEEDSDTTPNPLQSFTEADDSTEHNATLSTTLGENTEEYTTDSDETTVATTTSQSFMVAEGLPAAEARADSKTTHKKKKTSLAEAKHGNVAKEKSIRKEDISTDDDGFDNEEI